MDQHETKSVDLGSESFWAERDRSWPTERRSRLLLAAGKPAVQSTLEDSEENIILGYN